ncbi:MAG: T9SS type A sorting domain-containing protein [Chitinophagales bacterium]
MKYLLLPVTICSFLTGFSAGSYDLVYSILNTKCQNGACHSATAAEALKFDGTAAAVYSALVNTTPGNAAAAASGDKIVRMNQPYNSYLLRKCASWLDSDLSLRTGEGDSMKTVYGTNISKKEAEYIRQWIMTGAPQTGNVVDTASINAYYDDPTAIPFATKPIAPTNGMRIHVGPLFVPIGTEKEWLLKSEVVFPYDAEIKEIDGQLNIQSHHFLLFRFDDSTQAAAMPNGLRTVSLSNGTTSFDGNKQLTGAWQTSEEIHLPQGTALFWPKHTWLDYNYHSKNATGHVLPVDFYLSLAYTEHLPTSTTIEMKSNLVNNPFFTIPAQSVKTLTMNDNDNGNNETRYIWMMSSHTHKYGTGFNIFKKDPAMPGNIGDTIYKGNFDYKDGVDRGYYDWEHPSIRYFQPQYPIDMTKGIFCKTSYNNTGSSPVFFGLTTNDEMQLYYYMYTNYLPDANGISSVDANQLFRIVPNPMDHSGMLVYALDKGAAVSVVVTDINGKVVAQQTALQQAAGEQHYQLPADLSSGMYLAAVTVNGQRSVQKFVVR